MTKMRVHELAKELGMDNKELVDILQKKNVEIKNHMSTIEDNVADEIRREVSQKGEKKAPVAENKGEDHTAGQTEGKEAAAPKKEKSGICDPPAEFKKQQQDPGQPPCTAPGTSGTAGRTPGTGRSPSGARRTSGRRQTGTPGARGT